MYDYFEVNQDVKWSLVCNHGDFKFNFPDKLGSERVTFSDNAKTFQATNKVLKTLYIHREVACKLSNKKIECRFNLERAPWWGGFFEGMVGCVKRCLRKVLGNVWLNFDDLCTVLVKVKGT